MKVKSESEVTQLCPTLSDPMDCSTPGSSAHGIFQARVLVKNPPVNARDGRDVGSISGVRVLSGVGNGSPLQYCCLGNPTDRGAREAKVHGAAKSWT